MGMVDEDLICHVLADNIRCSNTGVLNTVVAETVTSEAHQREYFPRRRTVTTLTGSISSSFLGDALRLEPWVSDP